VLAGLGVFVYAAATQPLDAAELQSFETVTDPIAKATELHIAWFNEIKDLGQVFIISLLIPILTSLIGYIFGKSVSASTQGSD
jgi:hypothetical protein